ncbi:hypothetical protein GCM10010466_27950 [Planomonospora alba]|uniref:Uncharacterized protein n=1 Tax=Planomonospora alba TaxID=161354 RepID=A0ABP6N8J1_9ACTN
MANEITEGKAAARALAARLPGWTVWYGEHTRHFWALSRARRPSGASHAEAETAEELERAVRLIEDGAAPPPSPARETPARQASPQQAPAQQTAQQAPAPEASHPGPAAAPEPEPRRAEPVRAAR